jgi:hypothetical protein
LAPGWEPERVSSKNEDENGGKKKRYERKTDSRPHYDKSGD